MKKDYKGPERRKVERRSGKDRRKNTNVCCDPDNRKGERRSGKDRRKG